MIKENAITWWDYDELVKEYKQDIYRQYKTYDPTHAWVHSLTPYINYRGTHRIIVDFTTIKPQRQETQVFDPRPRPWVVVLGHQHTLTPKGLNYSQIKTANKVTPLKLTRERPMRYHTYEEALNGAQHLKERLDDDAFKNGIDYFTPRKASCPKCGYTLESDAQNNYPDSITSDTKPDHAYIVKIQPTESEDHIIHVCAYAPNYVE